MVTVWNPADEAQDFRFTLLFAGGHYRLPIHLEARATRVFNISEIIQNQTPDAEGNIIPPTVREGSAKIASTHADNERILVALDAGTFNVRNATCSWYCISCSGVAQAFISGTFTVAVGNTTDLDFAGTWNTGAYQPLSGTWTSSNTSVATVNSTGLVTGLAPGSTTIKASASNVDVYNAYYCFYDPICPYRGTVSAPGVSVVVTPRIDSISPAQGLIGTTVTVTINGSGFGTTPTVNAGTGITVTINSKSNTQIQASFAISSTAPAGNHSLTVTAGGQTSGPKNFFVQVPTSLSIVPGTDSTTAEATCSAGAAGTGCGVTRSFTYQVNDQDSPPQAIQAAGLQVWDEIHTTSPNNLSITGYVTTCTAAGMTNSGPCDVTTNSLGQFGENNPGLTVCSTVCRVNNACTTGGPTNADQTIHVGSSSIVQHLSYYCDHVLVNGQ